MLRFQRFLCTFTSVVNAMVTALIVALAFTCTYNVHVYTCTCMIRSRQHNYAAAMHFCMRRRQNNSQSAVGI